MAEMTAEAVVKMVADLTASMEIMRQLMQEAKDNPKVEEKGKEKARDGRKTLGKDFAKEVKEFGGKEEEYADWSWKWKIAIKAEDPKLLDVVEYVEGLPDQIKIKDLEEKMGENGDITRWATELYEVLGKKLEGPPLVTLKDVDGMDGFEVWRLLHRKNNSMSPAMALKSLVEVLVPQKILHEQHVHKALDEWSIKEKKFVREHKVTFWATR